MRPISLINARKYTQYEAHQVEAWRALLSTVSDQQLGEIERALTVEQLAEFASYFRNEVRPEAIAGIFEEEDDSEPYEQFITLEDLAFICPYANQTDIEKYLRPLNQTIYEFEIGTANRAADFLAQVAHESWHFSRAEELASGDAYEFSRVLGNVDLGDGAKFKGGGLMQATGRWMYDYLSRVLGADLLNHPKLLREDPVLAARSAGAIWQLKECNAVADAGTEASLEENRYRINGGTNGLEEVKFFWRRARQRLGAGSTPVVVHKINWEDFHCKISKHFTVGEVTNYSRDRIPQDGTIIDNILAHAKLMDEVRDRYGVPIIPTSWYRPEAINRRVGGVENSQHILGWASDTYPADNSIWNYQSRMDRELWSDRALGYGAVRGFVHADNRPDPIRWHY